MWLSTFEIRAGVALLRYRNRAENTVLMCEQTPDPVWFSCRLKSYLLDAYVESINGEFWVWHEYTLFF